MADTGGLLRALASAGDGRPSFPEYEDALTSATVVIVPGLVLAEVDYFLREKRAAMRKLVADIFDPGTRYEYELPLPSDVARALELDARFRKLNLGLVDGRRRARVAGTVSGFGSFIGSPYVFTGYHDAVRYLDFGPEETTFLLVRVTPGNDVQVVQQHLKARLPEADIWTRTEFSRRARLYWVIKTGAGGALLTAALLGSIVGAVIVSQTIYATTMERLEEFATLKAMGASHWYIRRVVLIQALVSSIIGCAIGLAVTFPSVKVVRGSIPWVYTPWWLPAGMILVSLLMCSLASTVSIRKAIRVEPGRVFRA